jgi:hypothetical protein
MSTITIKTDHIWTVFFSLIVVFALGWFIIKYNRAVREEAYNLGYKTGYAESERIMQEEADKLAGNEEAFEEVPEPYIYDEEGQ